MHQIYPDVALVPLLERLLLDDLHFFVFVNNVTPDRATVLAAFTTSGSSTTVTAADFTSSGVTAHKGTILGVPISVTNSSGGSADGYGYFITDVGNTQLLACARFDGAPITKAAGETWEIVPILGDSSALSS